MQYLLTAAQMRAADSYTSQKLGIPSLVLMERAALSLADAAEGLGTTAGTPGRAAVVCGSGNNGADGVAAGRILVDRGWQVRFFLTGSAPREGSSLEKQLQILHAYGLQEETFQETSLFGFHPDVIIDAIFGTGLSRNVTGLPERAIRAMESLHREGSSRILSADIPSGISSDTGAVMGCAVRADETLAFGFAKLGEARYPGCQYCGKLRIVDIGITLRSIPELFEVVGDASVSAQASLEKAAESHDLHEVQSEGGEEAKALYTFAYDTESAGDLLPERDPSGNKGTFGKVLVIAGSRNMCGAALLSSEAALRSGAGMVKIFTEECNRVIVQTKLPEMLLSAYEPSALEEEKSREAVFQKLSADLAWADTILMGPGIGRTDAAQWLVTFTLAWVARSEVHKRLVIDADAVRILGQSEEFADLLARAGRRADVVLTPHVAECAALLHVGAGQLKQNPPLFVKPYADAHNCSIVCKDARSTAVSCRSQQIYLNVSGNDALSTAGSGDVLAGMVAGLLAQGMPGFDALCAASWLHGKAAEELSCHHSGGWINTRSVTAADLLPALEQVLSVRYACVGIS